MGGWASLTASEWVFRHRPTACAHHGLSSAPLVQGKNKPSRRQRKKQANIIEERKPAMKVGGAERCCCCCCWAID